MKIYYRDFVIEGETKELIEFSLACFMGNINVATKTSDEVYVISPEKQAKKIAVKTTKHTVPTRLLDTKSPTLATSDQLAAFMDSIKPGIKIDISSRQGLRLRIINLMMSQNRLSVKEIMKKSGTDNPENVRKAIRFLRQAGCDIRVEHYYKQYGIEYFDKNVGPTSLITVMSIGTPAQGKAARQKDRDAWKKYYAKNSTPSTAKQTPRKRAVRVVEAQKLLDNNKQ